MKKIINVLGICFFILLSAVCKADSVAYYADETVTDGYTSGFIAVKGTNITVKITDGANIVATNRFAVGGQKLASNDTVILENGSITAQFVIIGNGPESDDSKLYVSGSNSTVNISKMLTVGNKGSDSGLIIENGGTVNAAKAQLGYGGVVDGQRITITNSSVLITGEGSSLNITNNLNLGFSNTYDGSLTVENGGTLTVGSVTTVSNSYSVIIGDGGTVDAGVVTNFGILGFTGGADKIEIEKIVLGDTGILQLDLSGEIEIIGELDLSQGSLQIDLGWDDLLVGTNLTELITATGGITWSSNMLSNITFVNNKYGDDLDISFDLTDDGKLFYEVISIPEPTVMALLGGVGFLAIALRRLI